MAEVKVVPAAHGWLWVLHGFALLRAYPAFWMLLLLFYWVALVLIGSVPFIGVVALILTVPGLAAGFMVACDAVQKKSPPMPAHLITPFLRDRRAQIILGIIYLTAMLALMGISRLIGGEVLMHLDTPDMPKGMAMELRAGGLAALICYTPVMLAFWFAPALCYWNKLSPAKALFFSFFASLRNSGAFFVYGLGWLLFMLLIPMVAGVALGAVLPREPQSAALAMMLLLPYVLICVCALMLSFYSTYVGVFGAPGATPPTVPAEPATPPAPPPPPAPPAPPAI